MNLRNNLKRELIPMFTKTLGHLPLKFKTILQQIANYTNTNNTTQSNTTQKNNTPKKGEKA